MSAPRYQPDVKSVTLASGIKLLYVECGARDGLPVIFLHGYTDSWRSWQLVLPHVSSEMRAIALTQRGHGTADKPETGYTPAIMAEDVAGFMDALKLDRAIIVGHSMGSVIGQHFAEAHPDRVAGLALLGALRSYGGNPVIEEMAAYMTTLTEAPDEAFVRDFQQSTLAQPVPHAFFEAIVAESHGVPLHVWRSALVDVLPIAPTGPFQAPTLIVWGDRDGVSPHADQVDLVRMLPDVRFMVYRGAGHGLHWEQPERFAADLTAFCNECTRLAGRAHEFEKEAA